MAEIETVGSKLLDEIERVSAKRERWRGYAQEFGSPASYSPGIMLMTEAIERGKRAIADNDPIASLQALEWLQSYNDED